LADGWAARPANAVLRHRAARRLQVLAETGVQHLSADHRIEEATERCLERLEAFARPGRDTPAPSFGLKSLLRRALVEHDAQEQARHPKRQKRIVGQKAL
jgi:hypothetical protein